VENTEKQTSRAALRSVAGCLLVQLCVGIIYLWSVLKSSVAESLNMSSQAAGMMASYMLMAFVVGGLAGGILTDRRGHRFTAMLGVALFAAGIGSGALLTERSAGLLVLTYAVAGGMGSGIAYSACVNCIQKWMPRRKGLASGLAIGAFGLSTVIFVPVMRFIMDAFRTEAGIVDFRGVFAVLGIGFFAAGILGCALISHPPETSPVKSGDMTAHEEMGLVQALRSKKFWCIFFIVFFINGAWNLATPMIYDLGLARGLTPEMAALALSLTGIANTAGRLLMAVVSDRLGRTQTLCLLAVMTAAASLLLISVGGAAYIAAICALAFAFGGPSSINAALTTDSFGSKHSAEIYGVVLLALGASSVFFNFLSSRVLGGSVAAAFAVGAVSAVIPLLFCAVMAKEGSSSHRTRQLIFKRPQLQYRH
jgi:OFA family oxalate/formate antiporter-like MFS transporter